MDTLADLASMQHHQHAARTATTAPSSLRNPVEPHDAPSTTHHTTATPQPAHPTTMRPSLQSISRAHSGSRSSIDIAMAEAPTQTPSPRAFASNSLSPEDLASLTELVQYLAEHPHAYAAHVRLIEILFAGLVTHVADETKDPRDYDLLADLQQAVEAMASRYALGEELWIRRLEMQRLLAGSLEDCLALVETLERAVVEEAGSTKIWAFYGDWMAALHDAAVGAEQSDYVPLAEEPLGRLVNLSDEDRLVAAEVFGRESLLAVWKRGVDATKYNLSYSQPLWNRYTALLLQDIAAAPAPEAVAALKAHFVDRLKTPHAQWEDTFQQFSTFMSTYDNAAYEQTMVAVNRQTADAKETRIVRETYEARLRNKIRDGDREAEWVASTQYLEWEMSHNRKKGKVFSYRLLTTLFQRVLLRFPTAAETWEELLLFLGDDAEPHPAPRASLLPTLNQACAHCPWSGALWAAYIQGAEREDLPFPDIGQIKHKATSTGLLDADTGQGQGQDGSDGGLENTLAVHAAWCGFLRRRAFRRDATDEERDVAEVGLRSALEDAETLGRRRQQEAAAAGTGGANGAHNEYRGDPQYRLERTYIKFLDQSRNVGAAREAWRGLVPRHGDSYEFWLRYYEWEMRTWARLEGGGSGGGVPRDATGVLQQAARRQQMDWPEKILETYQRHCEDHEDVATIQAAVRLVRKRARDVARRREREQAATQLQQQREQELAQLEVEENGDAMEEDAKTGEGAGKRKRDEATNGDSGSAAKRTKASPEASVEPAKPSKAAEPEPVRDREHTSVLVKGLPWDATEKRVRHFFRECGSIKSVIIAVDKGTASATATIEFDDKQDVLTARTKDMKQFDGREIHVEVGQGSIVYVTNFPPKADEEYLRSLFGKVSFDVLPFPNHPADTQFSSTARSSTSASPRPSSTPSGASATSSSARPSRRRPLRSLMPRVSRATSSWWLSCRIQTTRRSDTAPSMRAARCMCPTWTGVPARTTSRRCLKSTDRWSGYAFRGPRMGRARAWLLWCLRSR